MTTYLVENRKFKYGRAHNLLYNAGLYNMKKWLFLFIIGLYLFVPISMLELHPAFMWIPIILVLVSGCFNIANAVKMQRNPNDGTEISMKAIMILKICLLPVYVVCFIAFAGSVLMALSIWFTIPALFALPAVIAFSCFVLFVSSSLAISRIIILSRRGLLSIIQCIVHIILQLFFVIDVIDSIIVYGNERKSNC